MEALINAYARSRDFWTVPQDTEFDELQLESLGSVLHAI